MSLRLTASKLREDIYRILDMILETGKPVEIERGGKILRIVAEESAQRKKLESLEQHPGVVSCDPEEIVHMDWSGEWKP